MPADADAFFCKDERDIDYIENPTVSEQHCASAVSPIQLAHAKQDRFSSLPTRIPSRSQTFKVGSLEFVFGYGGMVLPKHGASLPLDDWIVVYQRGAKRAVKGDGENAIALRFHASSNLRKACDIIGETMLIRFPRATFKGLEHHIEAICNENAKFDASPLLLGYLESLWRHLPALCDSEQHVVEAVTIQLFRSCIVRTGELQESTIRSASRGRLESAKIYIDERISSPNLTVESVQAWLGISRRQLYSLFESYGGVARYILMQRLRKYHSAISDPLETRSIGRIAEQFRVDPAQFDRLFRREFGSSPDGTCPNIYELHGEDRVFPHSVVSGARAA